MVIDDRVEIELDVNEKIRLRNADHIAFEQKTGKPLVGWLAMLERHMAVARDDESQLPEALMHLGWTEMTALLWIIARRKDPSFTWEQALEAEFNPREVMGLFAMIEDPTVPATPS